MAEAGTSSYYPRPVDTSNVHLGADQMQVLESLARNIHDIWAQRRLADGWVFGPIRDDRKKTHPCLVPFDDLVPGEQDYDRTVAVETMKSLVQLGFECSRKSDPAMAAAGAQDAAGPSVQAPAHMDASRRPESVASALDAQAQEIERRIDPALREVDGEAIRMHRRYRVLAMIAAISGSLAVLLGILQLFVDERHYGIRSWCFAVEAGAAAITLVAVLYGIRKSIHHRWILRRHQAERLRALHAEALFRLVTFPLREDELDARIEELQHLIAVRKSNVTTLTN